MLDHHRLSVAIDQAIADDLTVTAPELLNCFNFEQIGGVGRFADDVFEVRIHGWKDSIKRMFQVSGFRSN